MSTLEEVIVQGASSSTVSGSRFPLALLWGSAAAMATLAVFPYLVAIQPELRELPMSIGLVAAAQSVQMLVVATLMAWVGLKAGASMQLGAPLTERWLLRLRGLAEPAERTLDRRARAPGAWTTSILTGVVGGALVLVGAMACEPWMPPPAEQVVSPGPWLGLLACFYGGIAEELQLRLFVVSGLAWLFSRLAKERQASVFAAVVIAALMFGLGHLPAAFGVWEPTTVVVLRTVLLNMALGLPFGFVYAHRGLEHAVVAHFSADLVLHVVAPLLNLG